jgi:carbon-monoxide dehydrogenase small subunit
MLLSAKALLDKNPDPSEREIREGIAGNICRCTGYVKIVKAVQQAAVELQQLERGVPSEPAFGSQGCLEPEESYR